MVSSGAAIRIIAIAVAVWLAGCQQLGIPADLSFSGGMSEILRRGVHVSWSIPMERVITVPRAFPQPKIGPPP